MVDAERIDRELRMGETDAPGAAPELAHEPLVAAAEIEDHRERVVLLRVGDEKVEQERLAGPGGALHERVPDIVVMEVPEIRRLMLGFKHRQTRSPSEVRAGPRASVQREEKAQIGDIRIQQRQPAEIVRAVARDHRQPGVEQVDRSAAATPCRAMLASAWIERPARDVQKVTAAEGVRHRNGMCG